MNDKTKSVYMADLDYFVTLLEKEPDAKLHLPAALLYSKLGRYDDAIKTAKEGLALYPDYTQLKVIMAEALVSLGLYREAGKILHDVLMTDENNYKASKLVGAILRQEGNEEKALKYLQTALLLAPEDREIPTWLRTMESGTPTQPLVAKEEDEEPDYRANGYIERVAEAVAKESHFRTGDYKKEQEAIKSQKPTEKKKSENMDLFTALSLEEISTETEFFQDTPGKKISQPSQKPVELEPTTGTHFTRIYAESAAPKPEPLNKTLTPEPPKPPTTQPLTTKPETLNQKADEKLPIDTLVTLQKPEKLTEVKQTLPLDPFVVEFSEPQIPEQKTPKPITEKDLSTAFITDFSATDYEAPQKETKKLENFDLTNAFVTDYTNVEVVLPKAEGYKPLQTFIPENVPPPEETNPAPITYRPLKKEEKPRPIEATETKKTDGSLLNLFAHSKKDPSAEAVTEKASASYYLSEEPLNNDPLTEASKPKKSRIDMTKGLSNVGSLVEVLSEPTQKTHKAESTENTLPSSVVQGKTHNTENSTKMNLIQELEAADSEVFRRINDLIETPELDETGESPFIPPGLAERLIAALEDGDNTPIDQLFKKE